MCGELLLPLFLPFWLSFPKGICFFYFGITISSIPLAAPT
jgi:hypothetical protein